MKRTSYSFANYTITPFFLEITFPDSWNALVDNQWAKEKGFGQYIYCKFYGFELVKKYQKVLWLDADMLIRGDISPLFEIEEYLAWRKVVAYNPNSFLRDYLRNADDDVSVGNGGLIYFSDKLNNLHIDYEKEVEKWSNRLINGNGGWYDEVIVGCIAYECYIPVKALSFQFNSPVRRIKEDTIIVHFCSSKYAKPKPWKNLASYLYFSDWSEYYQKWLEIGGEGPINYTVKDYYTLFGFEQIDKVMKLQSENKNWKKEYKALEAKYNALLNSKSWKLTAPLRKCAKWFRKLMKKLKKQR